MLLAERQAPVGRGVRRTPSHPLASASLLPSWAGGGDVLGMIGDEGLQVPQVVAVGLVRLGFQVGVELGNRPFDDFRPVHEPEIELLALGVPETRGAEPVLLTEDLEHPFRRERSGDVVARIPEPAEDVADRRTFTINCVDVGDEDRGEPEEEPPKRDDALAHTAMDRGKSEQEGSPRELAGGGVD